MERNKILFPEKKNKTGNLVALGAAAITIGAYIGSYMKLLRDRRKNKYGVGTMHPLLELGEWIDVKFGDRVEKQVNWVKREVAMAKNIFTAK